MLPALNEGIGAAALAFFQKALGPVAEAGEFLSDKIRFYRWEAALKTIEKAEKTARAHGVSPKEVPLKFLVPFLEKSSLEDGNDEITERWANLLVSASVEFKPESITFIDILSKLSPEDAKLLEQFVPEKFDPGTDSKIPEFAAFALANEGRKSVLPGLAGIVSKVSFKNGVLSDEGKAIVKFIIDKLENVFVERISVDPLDIEDHKGWSIGHPQLSEKILSLDVLISLGLASRSELFRTTSEVSIGVRVVAATALGFEFVRACRGDRISTSRNDVAGSEDGR